MKQFAARLVKYFNIGEELDQERLSVYVYGMNILLETALSMLVTLIAALRLGQVKEMLFVYLLIFIVRSFGGGFHFANFRSCLISSVGFILFILLLHKNMVISDLLLLCTFYFALTYIFLKGLSKNSSREYNKSEEGYYNFMIRIISIMIFILGTVLKMVNWNDYFRLLALTVIMLALIKAMGDIRYRTYIRRRNRKVG